ncbi:MAG: phosphohistidine phosphatase SixA [Dehalococcoidia bacterium]|nr:MAG: phosphohistidine phosphatase SixA [Dehalococcoidia bacterium]
MEIYLVQHGEAKPETEDPERPLTEGGRAEAESVARYVAGLGIDIVRILHSGKLRAQQTAEVFAQHMNPGEGVSERQGLSPKDDPHEVRQLIDRAEKPLMLVGHLPHLSRLAALLVSGDPDKEVVTFRMAGIVCLGKTDSGWAVNWAVIPEIVGA